MSKPIKHIIIALTLATALTLPIFVMAWQPVYAASCSSTGSGNWNVAASWTSCGGSFPQAGDSVTIKNFGTITMIAPAAAANVTLDSTGGVLNLGSQPLTVSGSFTNDTFSPVNLGGTVIFDASGDHTVNSFGADFTFSNLTFQSSGAGIPTRTLSLQEYSTAKETVAVTGALTLGGEYGAPIAVKSVWDSFRVHLDIPAGTYDFVTFTDISSTNTISANYGVDGGNNSNITFPAAGTVTDLTAAAGTSADSAIDLSWTDVAGESSYIIERSTSQYTGFAAITGSPFAADTIKCTDATGLSANTTYYYRLTADDGKLKTPYASATATTGAPPGPFQVSATSPISNGGTIARTGNISATFSRAVSMSTVSTKTFTVRGKQTGVYTGAYGGGSVVFTPTNNFKPGEEIVANLSKNIKATDGAALTPYAWQFQAAVGGDGSGLFAWHSKFGTGSDYTYSVALGDVDGDGHLDLAVVNSYLQNVVYLNDGKGNFDNSRNFGTGQDVTYSMALGDVDGDGDLDLAVGIDSQQNVVYLNDGSGAFTDSNKTNVGTVSDFTESVALGDVDGDGDLDLAVDDESNAVYKNVGSSASGTVTPGEGGVITSTDGNVRLDFPPGAVTNDTTVTITLFMSTTHSPPSSFGAGFHLDLTATDDTGQPVDNFNDKPFTFTYTYNEDELQAIGIDAKTLEIYFYNTDTEEWESIKPVTVDTVKKTVTVTLDHLTEFAVFGKGSTYLPVIVKG